MSQEMNREKTRYRVVRTGFWWRVAIGDGEQTVGRCYTEAEAERLASALLTAFRDGQFSARIPSGYEY
jgi:hypothetical protein